MTDNTLSVLILGAEYTSGPLAIADLHAGGKFFCVLYEEVLLFHPNHTVGLEVRILDEWRSFDDEAGLLRKESATGSYGVNSQGCLSCHFPNVDYTGLPCDINPEWLAFHVWDKRYSSSDSRVYTLRKQTASLE